MWKARLFLASALVALGAQAASAQDNPLANRPADPPAALKFLQGQGVKLTYLGEEGGLKGYLGENPNGKMQTFYLSPDGNHVIAGVLFRSGGINVTGIQIGDMQRRFEDAKKQMDEARRQLGGDIAGTPSMLEAPKAEAAKPEAPKADLPKPEAPKPDAVKPQVTGFDPGAAAPAKDGAAQYVSGLDKEAFLNAVREVAWFSVGASDAPVLYMVADPQCPFCHAAWAKLRPLVIDRKLAVNVIMIAGLNGSEPLAVSILSRKEPGKAWFNGEGSEKGVAIAPPPSRTSKEYKDAKTFLEINGKFAQDVIKLKGTPFFAYVGKDGKLYSAEGPKDLDAFLSAQ